MEAVGRFLEDAWGSTAEGAGYRPLPQVGGEDLRGASVCSASECGPVSRMLQEEGVSEGRPAQVGGALRRRRSKRHTRRRRSQRGGRRTRSNAGRFAVNARIRIRLPRH